MQWKQTSEQKPETFHTETTGPTFSAIRLLKHWPTSSGFAAILSSSLPPISSHSLSDISM
jgi:hypothetical protein